VSELFRITLQPLGLTFEAERGSSLRDLLADSGVEFPCGGLAECLGCRVRILAGALDTSTDDDPLPPTDVAAGWRLACRGRVAGDLTLEVAQWQSPVLGDHSVFPFTPRPGLGVAVDLGSTTVVAQLVDRETGQVLAVESALNPQTAFGADIMSRLTAAADEEGRRHLRDLSHQAVGSLVEQLLSRASGRAGELTLVRIVGNTVMHHLFCGLDVTPLMGFPFASPNGGGRSLTPEELGWQLPGAPHPSTSSSPVRVEFLPCLGGFVGSDVLAGVLATRLHQSPSLAALIDLGTNGEIVVGNSERLLCASTAAGPAFEGARISMGMRAGTGAISEVHWNQGAFHCRVLGAVPPRGVCGSGLVDAVAAGLQAGLVDHSGRLLTADGRLMLAPPVCLTQTDIRELQLGKAAIAAGLRVLLERWGATLNDLTTLHVSGAFGNYVNLDSAHRIGLLGCPRQRIHAAGNTALLGAKLALFDDTDQDQSALEALRQQITHVSLAADPRFSDAYLEALPFPPADAPQR
jgi:uncharacterized 2Fe-2S/4Fe-4S cluster protein (DUF4445 family)